MAKRTKITTTLDAKDNTKTAIQTATQNIDKLGKAAQANAKKIQSSFGALKVAAVAAVGVAANNLKNSVINFAASTDQIAKNSRAIGLTAESYQKLAYAADRQGVSTDQLYGSMKKFAQSMGQVKTGIGGVATALAKSNPALLQQLKNAKNNEEAFLIAADAIKAIPDVSERAVLSMQIFGKSGIELNKVFEAGSDGIKSLMDEQEKYGIITTEQANQSEAFIDAITKLKAAATGLGNTMTAAILPVLTPVIEGIVEWIANNKPLIQSMSKMLVTILKLAPAIAAFAGTFILVYKGAKIYSGVMSTLKIVQSAAAVSGGILNAVLNANPIMLVATGIALAVAALVLLYMRFEKVRIAVKAFGKMIVDIFKNFLPILTIKNFVGVLKSLYDLFTGKKSLKEAFAALGQSLIKFFLTPLESIKNTFKVIWDFILGIFNLTKSKSEKSVDKLEPPKVESTPLMVQEQEAKLNEARYISETKQSSSIDINFNNLPPGVLVEQTKAVPGVTLNLGYAGS